MITMVRKGSKAAIGQTTLLEFYMTKDDTMPLKEVGLYITSWGEQIPEERGCCRS